jgi:hypothetical protein
MGKVQDVQRKLSAEDREVIEQLLLEWDAASTDSCYYEAILRGTWPNANEIKKAMGDNKNWLKRKLP